MEEVVAFLLQRAQQFLHALLAPHGLSWESFPPAALAAAVSGGFAVLRRTLARRALARDLRPYYTRAEVHAALKDWVSSRFQSEPPCNGSELLEHGVATARQPLLPWMLDALAREDDRFFLLLGDSGMGKTTFMIKLFVEYRRQGCLARLVRHGWPSRRYPIRLLPLGHPETLSRIKQIKDRTNTILLLDSMEESASGDERGLEQIVDAVKDFRAVVMTCRTQFFSDQKSEPDTIGVPKLGPTRGQHRFKRLYLAPFELGTSLLRGGDVGQYLRKKFGWFSIIRRIRAWHIVERSPKLMVRPMLLARIDTLLRRQAGGERYQYASQVYEQLIEDWYTRESDQPGRGEPFQEQQRKFSNELAQVIYLRGQIGLDSSLEFSEIEAVALRSQIRLSRTALKVHSLLNRNAQGRYKFAHASILEFLLAKQIAGDPSRLEDFSPEEWSDTAQFLAELHEEWAPNLWQLSEESGVVINTPSHAVASLLTLVLTRPDIKEFHFANARGHNFDAAAHTQVAALTFRGASPRELSGVSKLVNLQALTAEDPQLADVTALSTLGRLRALQLSGTQVSDLSALAPLARLEKLELVGTRVVNLLPLSSLRGLKWLRLDGTQVADVSDLAPLRRLQVLYLGRTLVCNIAGLASLSSLQRLHLDGTRVSDISPLQHLSNLELLDLDGTRVSDLRALAAHVHLERVCLSNTPVWDLRPLGKLRNLRHLMLDGTRVSDLTPLAALVALEELDLDETGIEDISALRSLVNLRRLRLSGTKVRDITALSALGELRELDLDRTLVRDVSCLRSLTKLKVLRLRDCPVTDVSALRDLSSLRVLDLEGTSRRPPPHAA